MRATSWKGRKAKEGKWGGGTMGGGKGDGATGGDARPSQLPVRRYGFLLVVLEKMIKLKNKKQKKEQEICHLHYFASEGAK